MSLLAGAAATLHVLESLYTFYLTRFRLNMKPGIVFLWTINILIVGIFGKSYLHFNMVKMSKCYSRSVGLVISPSIPVYIKSLLQDTRQLLL